MAITTVDMNNGIPEDKLTAIDESQGVEDADQARLDAVLADQAAEDAAAAAAAGGGKEGENKGTAADAETPEGEGKPATGEADPEGGKGQTVPVAAVAAARAKARENEAKAIASQATLDTLANLAAAGVQLTPAQLQVVLSGKSVAEATQEAEADPYDALDAIELALVAKRTEGEIDEVEFTKQQQAINRDRRKLDREQTNHALASTQSRSVENTIADTATRIENDFEIFRPGKLPPNGLEVCKPAAVQQTYAQMEEMFGPGVAYNDFNPKHREFFLWNLAVIADKIYGEGLGPISQREKPNGQGGKGVKAPTAKQAVNTSPPGRAAAQAALLARQGKAPPDLQQFTHSADTELGVIERKVATATTEEFAAIQAKNPELVRQLLEG